MGYGLHMDSWKACIHVFFQSITANVVCQVNRIDPNQTPIYSIILFNTANAVCENYNLPYLNQISIGDDGYDKQANSGFLQDNSLIGF